MIPSYSAGRVLLFKPYLKKISQDLAVSLDRRVHNKSVQDICHGFSERILKVDLIILLILMMFFIIKDNGGCRYFEGRALFVHEGLHFHHGPLVRL